MSEHPEQMIDRLERNVLVLAPPERVWEVVTGSDWLAEEVQLELAPGGEAQFVSESTSKTGWVEEAKAPTKDESGGGRLVFWWGSGDEPATRVELTLEPEGEDATRLRVTETRPLELLDLVGMPFPGGGGEIRGPAMLVAA